MIELSELERNPSEAVPLNGTVQQETCLQVEYPEPAQARQQNPWQFCNEPVKAKYKLWMAIVSIFIGLIVMIFISLIIHEASYRDEDENEILELTSNKTFLVTLKIPEDCVAEEDTLSNELSKRLTNLYSSSPALSRYFAAVEIADSSDNSSVAYHLHFAVPSGDDIFMKYMMSEELVLGILRQHFHDQNVSDCETLGIDPASLSLSLKWSQTLGF
ncbi:TPA-induced transmembrane protein [Trichosurus vulpecula]|uniref:TPA-induced transmembrane protein n=1 Tax=Trichosurus vulpecula TaxID=9337 RepID=UPI00186AC7A0|nr:TPA-induced transmembrane protein [Trichosurus vulpecula]